MHETLDSMLICSNDLSMFIEDEWSGKTTIIIRYKISILRVSLGSYFSPKKHFGLRTDASNCEALRRLLFDYV